LGLIDDQFQVDQAGEKHTKQVANEASEQLRSDEVAQEGKPQTPQSTKPHETKKSQQTTSSKSSK